MADKIIRFTEPTEDSLFDGTSAQERAGIDISASIAKFTEELTGRIKQAYPEAEVRVDSTGRRLGTYYDAYGFETPDDPNSIHNNYDVSAVCQGLAEELFDDGSLWMVEG